MEKEIWKDVKNYEGLYQCSNLGRIKSLGNGKSGNSKERILKQEKNKYGYYQIRLCKDGKRKMYFVHRLVCSAFLPNPQNLPFVNHIDENPSNNTIENLEFCTAKYNNNYGKHNERVAKALSKPILQFNKQGTKIIGKFNSVTQASKELNINCGHICECCNGKLKTCAGSKWLYLEDYVNRMEKLYNLALKKVS